MNQGSERQLRHRRGSRCIDDAELPPEVEVTYFRPALRNHAAFEPEDVDARPDDLDCACHLFDRDIRIDPIPDRLALGIALEDLPATLADNHCAGSGHSTLCRVRPCLDATFQKIRYPMKMDM